jgi:SAM-dependent methyltransferase
MDECRRVLKPGGVAIFHEPIRVPAFDGLRDSKFGLWLAPKTVSFETHITEDEKKLCDSDLDVIRTLDPGMTVQRFLLFSRFEKVLRSQHEHLEQLDFRLIQLMPFLGKFGGRLVVTLRP